MDPNIQLMQKIRVAWDDAIVMACASSSVPPSFLAALIANESAGNKNAQRFEKGVLDSLWQVLLGRAPAYGSLKRDDLYKFMLSLDSSLPQPARNATDVLTSSMLKLDGLATSWGLTQVMGYEAIAFHLDGFARLADPAGELSITLKMLADFARRFNLDLNATTDADASELFDCWNSGRPHAPTADPQYIPNGLARMKIYANLSSVAA